MSKTLFPPTVNDAGLFTRDEALSAGWSDQDLRKHTDIRRVIHGVYALRDVPLTHTLKCRAMAMRLPEDAVLTGRSAATLHGVELAAPNDRVELLVSRHKYMNRRNGSRCWSVRSWPAEHRPWQGIRLANPERAALDLLARTPLKTGVANVDALLHAGLVRHEKLEAFLSGRQDHGIRRARVAFGLLDGRAESIPESVLRLTLREAELFAEPQLEVREDGYLLARLDLGFRSAKVGVEYDGAWHADPEQIARDRRRLARLRSCGWLVVVVTAQQLRDAPERVVRRVRDTLRTRGQ